MEELLYLLNGRRKWLSNEIGWNIEIKYNFIHYIPEIVLRPKEKLI
jgi:hypothetical protein